ncbi:MAG TPA: chorismate synthase, partial [Solirubrobacteraceae bacterium]|nr:chorismate synthase [Solirubrobacteraceae bacterium]
MTIQLTTAGESHGPGLTCIIEGLPAGLVLDREAIDRDLGRRQLGHGRGGRMKIEQDRVEVTGGVRH